MGASQINQKMIKFIHFLFLWFIISSHAFAETYVREYTYKASDADSKLTSRSIALEQVKILLLQELGTHIWHEINISRQDSGEEISNEDLEAITAGFTKIKILEENWNGEEYYLKAKIGASADDVANAVNEYKNRKSKNIALMDSIPKNQKLGLGQVVYVKNDGRCASGQVVKITGGKRSEGIPRKYECVEQP